jgi:class 3 adenylate cyclase/predicted ATPase
LDIDGWLRGIGLPQYAELFRANDIDGELLGRLTNDDLKDIGVASFGHRKKLLEAIAELGGAPAAIPAAPPVVPASIPATVAPPPISASVEAAGERRYLTVMFCDLVGSTGIAAKLDAEEWRDLVGAYVDAASAAVTQMGGHVAKKLGDGILALFGYPLAQENDAERAARAALAIQRALAELNRNNAGSGKPELAARIGLEAGPVVVDAAGEIFGDAPNVAARVQALAEPGSVLITAQVQRQVAGLFVVEERGSHTLKGVPEPMALYHLVRASGGGRHSGARQLTPLVGRDDEMTTLMRRWERARHGDGQLVMIVGEPGLGKSRLIEEFHGRLREVPHTWTEWSCSQLLQNTPLHPLAEWGRQRFGSVDVPAERRLADLKNTLTLTKLDPGEFAPLLAPLLDIPLPKERMPSLAPDELRRRQLAALINWTIASAKMQPVVLAFEDLHWADPTTLDVLRAIAERGAQVPLMIVATTRPEFRPPWSMRSHHGTISLAPLDRSEVRDMVAELSARHALPQEVVDDVAARTGGVPLFVEEVTRLLLERGGESGIHAIPPTLQQSLMARLDRLGPAREVAQMGSVIGRGFSYALLRDVAGLEDAPLRAALEKLAEADILLVQGAPPESGYRFKHALIQDAAYENLLKSRRQVLHRRVAEILRDRFAATAAAEPEALAHHFTQAGMTDAAIEWWGKAGDQALRRSAFQEAIAHLGKAIEMADAAATSGPGAPAKPPLSADRVRLQTSYGQALIWTKGYEAQETTAAFARAVELAGESDGSVDRFSGYYGLWVGALTRGEPQQLQAMAERFRREVEARPRSPVAVVGHRILGMTHFVGGDFVTAYRHFQQALALYDRDQHRDLADRFGQDPGPAARIIAGLCLLVMGQIDEALKVAALAAAEAQSRAHVPTMVYVRLFKALLSVLRGGRDTAMIDCQAYIDLVAQHDLPQGSWVALKTFYQGWMKWRRGELEAGIADMRNGIGICREHHHMLFMPFFEPILAAAEAETGATSLTRIDEEITELEKTGLRPYEAETYRIRSEILLRRDPTNTAPAEEAFLTAIAIAQQQKAKSFELRAALSLAKLHQSTGRPTDAHALLAPALEGFSPTPEFPEIAEAQTLLSALAETEEVKNAAEARHRRLKLQTSYGQAMAYSRGYAAEETKAAFARASELTEGIEKPAERFVTYFMQWTDSSARGDVAAARETAETFLREAEKEGRATERVVGMRILGLSCIYQGDFVAAQAHLREALRTYDPERDSDAKFRFGQDAGAAVSTYLGFTNWVLGQVGDARARMDEGIARAAESNSITTQVNVYLYRAIFEAVQGDVTAARRDAETVVELSREHGLSLFAAWGALANAWARAWIKDQESGIVEFREALETFTAHGTRATVPLYQGRLAELEAEESGVEAALARIDGALVLASKTGEHWSDSLLHRIRGEILLKRDPANTAAAEEAFLTATAIAQRQQARSFELRAALSLAKLYQSSGRAADAQAVLAPGLEGFTPTSEFPEIAEAQALLAALAETDEVKNAAEARQRRLKLQTNYGQAVMWSKGFASEEAKSAFARARELAERADNPQEVTPPITDNG